jgi:formyltetrahydrofolate-dependent phosphoribosylglycinamide formyltransferase
MKKIAVLASGRGSNLEAFIKSCQQGELRDLAYVGLIIIDRPSDSIKCISSRENIDCFCFNDFYDILNCLKKSKVDLICLAGFLSLVPEYIINAFCGKILNIHPSILPKFGGKGMYGIHVHKAVIEAGEKMSGATVHFVDKYYDHGQIIFQESVEVFNNDTPESLSWRILQIEHKIYSLAIKKILEEK